MSRRGWTLFLAMAVIWGIPYLLIRVAVRHLDPGVLVLLRTGPASILLTPIVLARRQIPVLIKNLRWIIIFGVVEFGIPWYCMATAEKHISSSLTSLLICCVPLFAVLVPAHPTHRRSTSRDAATWVWGSGPSAWHSSSGSTYVAARSRGSD